MDRHELFLALRRGGVAPGEMWIQDAHEPVPLPPEFVFLRRVAEAWQTGVFERGAWHVVADFTDEAAACDHALHVLALPRAPSTDPPMNSSPDSPPQPSPDPRTNPSPDPEANPPPDP
ncbi:hypothetical protein [Embleya scabrispora]|uniref:hypothetical protein n=1 Tax=Embleya scabrispora TaxID=159449 RepID=UPI00131A47BB|nr:hypothetical protein [Embleya scabrispora]MYS85855.1 hypothetical protein [Streptomyces sp. SID5474]